MSLHRREGSRVIDNLKLYVNNDSALVRRGRWVSLQFLLGVGEKDFLIDIDRGFIKSVGPRVLATDAGCFTIRATQETWAEHWSVIPKRDYHDIWSMLPKGLAIIDGDLLPLMQNLQYFKDVIASPRGKEA